MIILVAIMVWIGRKRGMNYWNWIFAYLIVSAVNMVFTAFIVNQFFAITSTIACLAILITFFFWPLIVDKEEKEQMSKKIEEYKMQDEQEEERINEILNEWVVINVYTDKNDEVRIANDIETLQNNNISTNAKYTSGFTTISVRKEHIKRSCELLDVDLPCIRDEDAPNK